MDQIAQLLAAALKTADAKAYDDLIAAMTAFEAHYPYQMTKMSQVPAIDKLWTAIKGAV